MFKRAYEDALRLDTEMQAGIDSKKEMIASIELEEYNIRVSNSTCMNYCNFK